MGTYTPPGTFTNASEDPGPPYLDAAFFNDLTAAVQGAHSEINTLDGRVDTLEAAPGMSDADILAAVLRVDGPGSGIDADLLDGLSSADFLRSNQPIPTSLIPSFAISEPFVVASQAAMLALSQADPGDLAIRTDFDPDRTYILVGSDPTVLANWVRMTFGDVVSVNGQTGAINLVADDVGAGPSSHVGAGGAAHANAVAGGAAGFMSGTDKSKLDSIEAGATAGSAGGVPTGAFLPYGGAAAPTGWLLCDGAAVSRTTYAALYEALGGALSPWGQGDGSTTFNVPDLRGRVPMGAGAGTGLTARSPGEKPGAETHALTAEQNGPHEHAVYAGQAFNTATGGSATRVSVLSTQESANHTGATGQTGGGQPHPNVQPSLVVNYIIKA